MANNSLQARNKWNCCSVIYEILFITSYRMNILAINLISKLGFSSTLYSCLLPYLFFPLFVLGLLYSKVPSKLNTGQKKGLKS